MQEGSHVEEFEKICEVQSDKAAVEITSRYAGTIKKLHHSTGDVVQVQSLCLFVNCASMLVISLALAIL